jgi:hypothetical protein
MLGKLPQFDMFPGSHGNKFLFYKMGGKKQGKKKQGNKKRELLCKGRERFSYSCVLLRELLCKGRERFSYSCVLLRELLCKGRGSRTHVFS